MFYSKLFDPASRQHSWFVCPRWVWLCSTFMNPLTHPWRFAPTPCSGCLVGASPLELPSHFLSARSHRTLRPSTSAVSLSHWASLEPPACWRFVIYKICTYIFVRRERSLSFLIPLYIIRSAFVFYLQSIKRKDDPQEVKVQMQFMVYGTRPSKDKSGAYLFLPDGKAKVFPQMFTCLSGVSLVWCTIVGVLRMGWICKSLLQVLIE